MRIKRVISDKIELKFDELRKPETEIQSSNVDECALQHDLCAKYGPEAGCHDTPDGYLCLCNDLEVVHPNHGCDRNIKNETVTGDPSLVNQTEKATNMITFKPPQLSRNVTTVPPKPLQSNEAVEIRGHNFLLPLIITLIFVSLMCAFVFLWKKKSSLFFNRRNNQIENSKGTLAKCIQQYVTNPNYYSSSPETPLRKIFNDLELPVDKINILEEIGEGCFGKVYKGKLFPGDNYHNDSAKGMYANEDDETIQVAIKMLKDGIGPEGQSDFEREVEILSTFKHQNIVKLIGIWNGHNSMPSMVFEFMSFGDLAELLRRKAPSKTNVRSPSATSHSEANTLTQDDLIFIATQIANGMLYLSSQHFVHRDLATRNCLVDQNLIVKISDFGMSRDIYTCDYYKVNGSRMLPVRWMPPESILYGKFTLESDVWSFGVVLWEIFTFGKQPYYGHSNDEVVKLILQGILLIPPEDCPQCIYSLMAGCWKTELKDRIKFATIFKELLENCSKERQELICSQNESISNDNDEEVLDTDNYLVPKVCFVNPNPKPNSQLV